MYTLVGDRRKETVYGQSLGQSPQSIKLSLRRQSVHHLVSQSDGARQADVTRGRRGGSRAWAGRKAELTGHSPRAACFPRCPQHYPVEPPSICTALLHRFVPS